MATPALAMGVAAGGLHWAGTPFGGLLWVIAVFLAALGYGVAFERVTRERTSSGMTAVLGLCLLLGGSAVLARVGLLTRATQISLVLAGLPWHALRRSSSTPTLRPGAIVFVALAGLALLVAELAGPHFWVTPGVNHVMEVKRLWDTGTLSLPYQLGLQVIGESYATLMSGPMTAGVFDAGLCVLLLVLLLAEELSLRDDPFGLALFAVIAVPVVLNPEPTSIVVTRWFGTLLHVAMFVALSRRLRQCSSPVPVIVLGIALGLLRHEFLPLAVPYVAAALLEGRALRVRRVLGSIAVAEIIALALVRGSSSPLVLVLAAAAVAGAALATWGTLQLVGTFRWRSPVGVLCFAVFTSGLAVVLGVIAGAAHGPELTPTLWMGAAIVMLSLVDRSVIAAETGRPRLYPLPAAALVGVFVVATAVWPNEDEDALNRVYHRVADALGELEHARLTGYEDWTENAVRALQGLTPRGAPIAFWGGAAGGLDYTRNPILDVSWSRTEFLAVLPSARLARMDFLIVENVEALRTRRRRPRDLWGRVWISPLEDVARHLEPVAEIDGVRLYRVMR